MESLAGAFAWKARSPHPRAARTAPPKLSGARGRYREETKRASSVQSLAHSIVEKVGETMQKTARAEPDLLEHLSSKNKPDDAGVAPAGHPARSPIAARGAERKAARQPGKKEDEYRFRVVIRRHGSATERTLAYTSDIAIARAIFSAATKRHPDHEIKLCEGARILEQTISSKSSER